MRVISNMTGAHFPDSRHGGFAYLQFLDGLFDLLDFDFAEALDFEEGLSGRSMDRLRGTLG